MNLWAHGIIKKNPIYFLFSNSTFVAYVYIYCNNLEECLADKYPTDMFHWEYFVQ